MNAPAIVQARLTTSCSAGPSTGGALPAATLDRLAAAPRRPTSVRASASTRAFRPPASDPAKIDRFNLAQLLTGSEGTLAVMTDITLGLETRPTRTALGVVHFDDVVEACAAITDILETEPSACELLDKHLMDLARAQPEWARRLHFVEGDPAAVLFTEYYRRR